MQYKTRYVSTSGESWRVVSSEEFAVLPITDYLYPNDLGLTITFESTEGRYLRITDGQCQCCA